MRVFKNHVLPTPHFGCWEITLRKLQEDSFLKDVCHLSLNREASNMIMAVGLYNDTISGEVKLHVCKGCERETEVWIGICSAPFRERR